MLTSLSNIVSVTVFTYFSERKPSFFNFARGWRMKFANMVCLYKKKRDKVLYKGLARYMMFAIDMKHANLKIAIRK
ncbi:hypothetical protein PAAL66ix_08666 [Paenibacillus alvei A6-6i-x]|nr:hypothetical protein PAAL66ix_08666 [Paenibacillus alvei A6-6i-x]